MGDRIAVGGCQGGFWSGGCGSLGCLSQIDARATIWVVPPRAERSIRHKHPTLAGNSFGDNLRAARESAGLSREQLGMMAGLNAATIYRLEAGDRQPRLPTILLLAEVLGLTGSDLIRNL